VAEPLTPDEVKKIRNDYNFILNLASKDQTGSVRKFWNDLRKVIRNSDGDTTIITAYVNREFPKVEYFKNLYGAQAEAEIQGARPELAADVNRAVDVKRQAVNAAIEKYGIELPEGQLDILAREAWRNNWGVTEIELNLRPFLADTLETGKDLKGIAGDFQNDIRQ